ncbi:MAG: hypothetical protein Q4A67_06685 [Aerococcus sp.]|nr:hypothetical protein [Aerococcus sp.]
MESKKIIDFPHHLQSKSRVRRYNVTLPNAISAISDLPNYTRGMNK